MSEHNGSMGSRRLESWAGAGGGRAHTRAHTQEHTPEQGQTGQLVRATGDYWVDLRGGEHGDSVLPMASVVDWTDLGEPITPTGINCTNGDGGYDRSEVRVLGSYSRGLLGEPQFTVRLSMRCSVGAVRRVCQNFARMGQSVCYVTLREDGEYADEAGELVTVPVIFA